MSDMSRKEAIRHLKIMRDGIKSGLQYETDEAYKEIDKLQLESLQLAISSLETDEAYQLEHESTTKNDLTEQCIACKYDETEDEHGEHCKKCLEGDSQFGLDEAFANPVTKNDLGVEECVSRRAVDSLIWEYLREGTDDHIAFYEHFLDLPPVTPQEPRWIPVSERLPEENGGYLVTVKGGYVTSALWGGNAEYWNEVTAWMPLPKAYREVEG